MHKDLIKKFNATWLEIDTIYNEYAKKHSLSYTAVLLLRHVLEYEGHYTQVELANVLGLPKQGIHSIVKDFLEKGYLNLREAKDRRYKEIILTEAGKSFTKDILKSLNKAEEALQSLEEEEIEFLVNIMVKYIERLKTTL